jgi:hypothetical protein
MQLYSPEDPVFEELKLMSNEDWSQAECFINNNSGELNPFYGKTHSEETKALISKNRKGKGRDPRPGTCSGEANPMYGKFGKDNPNYGKKRNDDFKLAQSKRFSGKNNPMYGKKPIHTIPEYKKLEIANKFKSGMTRKDLYNFYAGVYSPSTIKRAIRNYE